MPNTTIICFEGYKRNVKKKPKKPSFIGFSILIKGKKMPFLIIMIVNI